VYGESPPAIPIYINNQPVYVAARLSITVP
jgi:hypothetical protein